NAKTDVVDNGQLVMWQENAADAGGTLELCSLQEGAVKGGSVKLLRGEKKWRSVVEVTQKPRILTQLDIFSETAAQCRLAVTEDVPGKADARLRIDTFEPLQAVRVTINARDSYTVRIRTVTGRDKLPRDDGRKYTLSDISRIYCPGWIAYQPCERIESRARPHFEGP